MLSLLLIGCMFYYDTDETDTGKMLLIATMDMWLLFFVSKALGGC